MSDDPIDEIRVPVRRLCEIARPGGPPLAYSYYYAEVKRGRAPKPKGGVTLREAREWLLKRAAKQAAKLEAMKRLEDLAGSLTAGTEAPAEPSTASARRTGG